MLNRRTLATLSLFIVLAAGCVTNTRRERPIVLDERGRVVSELIFPRNERDIVLPLRFDGALLITDDVKINGEHVGTFIIDTGAMCSALDRETAQKLGLMPNKRLRDLKTSRLRRPDGLYHIDAIDIGGVGVRNHVIAVVDLSSVRQHGHPDLAGVLGADVWAMMPFTVDYRARQVIFHAREHFRPPPPKRAACSPLLVRHALKAPSPFSLANPHAGAPLVPITINGEPADAMLDTGSGGSIVLLPRLVAKRPQWVRGDRLVARAAGAGGAVGLAGRGLVGANVERVDALGVRFTNIDSAMGLIEDNLPRDRSSAIVGVRLLSHLRLTFDYASEKVWAEVK
ncbi:MAG: hypothetical protein QOF78_387 [Phycisphaerales bacterium]|jgi:predicted aspartyl protease|nr:hypothetical protein [Phycisphaerales bacterium]